MQYKLKDLKNKLYIVSTPIGNLEEISPRVIKALKESSVIFCEDTRVSLKLLKKIGINDKKLISYQKFNENDKTNYCIELIKKEQCSLISDAGYPCLSDPGFNLVNECYKENIGVEVINGPCSVIHAIVASGLNLNNFMFVGFLNASDYQRKQKLKTLINIEIPIVLFESVHRIKIALKDIYDILNNPYLVVCRELTKINETIYRGFYEDIKDLIVDKGEFVIIVQNQKREIKEITIKECLLEIKDLVEKNKIKLKDASKIIATKYSKVASELYQEFIIKFKGKK